MAIQIIDGFQTILSEQGPLLMIESDRLDEYVRYAKDKSITRIAMQRNYGYKLENVGFLEEHNFFTTVTIGEDINNISAVHYVKDIQTLSLSIDKQSVDLTKFPHLTKCSINWNNNIVGLDKENEIKLLIIWQFKPKSKNFEGLKGCIKIESLEITESNIQSLNGIEKLKQLNHLETYYVRNLKNLKGLEKLPYLKNLWLNNCPNLEGYETDLRCLKHLEQLRLNRCGDLPSLQFIQSLPKLKTISFVGTNVVDGNMTPTLELEYAGYDNKRHYSHKMKERK